MHQTPLGFSIAPWKDLIPAFRSRYLGDWRGRSPSLLSVFIYTTYISVSSCSSNAVMLGSPS